jgi:hypothetical protein
MRGKMEFVAPSLRADGLREARPTTGSAQQFRSQGTALDCFVASAETAFGGLA